MKGQLSELIDIIVEEKTALFVCATGVPPLSAVERLHGAGIPIMNMSILTCFLEVSVTSRFLLSRVWSEGS